MRTSRQRLGRGQFRETPALRRLKARPSAQAHGEFRPPAPFLCPGAVGCFPGGARAPAPESSSRTRTCAGVGLAHAHRSGGGGGGSCPGG